MSLALVAAQEGPGLMIALVIGAVTASSALLAFAMWHAWKEAERAEHDLRYRRRVLLRLGLLYLGSAVFGIVEVVTGREPKEVLFGLPVGAVLAWGFLRAAIRVKVPPT
jgi:hypothetical protein